MENQPSVAFWSRGIYKAEAHFSRFGLFSLRKTDAACIIDLDMKIWKVMINKEEVFAVEAMKVDSFCEFRFVSNPGFSPDGSRIAFVVQQADMEENGYQGDLYLYERQTKTVRRLTTAGDAKSYVFTDRGSLLFAAGREKDEKRDTTSYYEIPVHGGEAYKKFEVPFKATRIFHAGNGRYLLLAAIPVTDAEKENPAYQVIDEVPFWFNGKGFTNKKRQSLYLYQEDTGDLLRISEDTAEVSEFSVRGNLVLYKAYPWTDVRGSYEGVYLYNMETGENRCLLEKDVRRTGMICLWADDEALITSCEDNPHGDRKYMDFYTMKLSDGEMKLLTPYDFGSGGTNVGSDARMGGGRSIKAGDGVCYFITTRGESAFLCSIDQSGVIRDLVAEKGSCDSFDIYDGHIVVCGFYDNKLAELYLDGVQITSQNNMEQWQLSIPEEVTFTASDGYTLTGWIMKPVGYIPGKKYPAILNIHGGPRSAFGSILYHEMQVWAGAGYFVFFTNPRGSDGFGTDFGDVSGRYGTIDYDNLMEFTDHVLSCEPDIDESRLGLTGGSYGGFMTNWIIGHTDRFAAAASQRSIANWISYEYSSDIGHTFTKYDLGAFAIEDVKKLWDQSPIQFVGNCKTPTLFIHSDSDYRCNVSEGIEMFAALKVLGVETRMCMFRGENHELSRSGKPGNRVVRIREILDWMDSHLKPEQEKEAR